MVNYQNPSPSIASAKVSTSAPAAALTAHLQTRASFWTRKNGGGMRTARKAFMCQQFGCLRRIETGETYFDTLEVTTWPKTKRICTCCSEELV
jgi:hypothetical protein